MLYTVNKSSFEKNSLKTCISVLPKAGVILLIEDGVISAVKNTNSTILTSIANEGRVFALKADIEARGISTKVSDNIIVIDYEGFVDLVVEHGTTVSWL